MFKKYVGAPHPTPVGRSHVTIRARGGIEEEEPKFVCCVFYCLIIIYRCRADTPNIWRPRQDCHSGKICLNVVTKRNFGAFGSAFRFCEPNDA